MGNKDKNEYFYCYSPRLKSFLKSQNFYYLKRGYNHNSDSIYFKFVKSNELDSAIRLWNLLKKIKSEGIEKYEL